MKRKKQADVFIVFAFGKLVLTNKQIANRLFSLMRHTFSCREIYTQVDLKNGLDEASKIMQEPILANITVAKQEEYISTLQIVKQFAEIAAEKKWKKVVVVAHRSHIKRCVRDLEKYGFEVVLSAYPLHTYWYHQDPQWWVRSKVQWWLRELPLRILPFSIYKKLSSI